MQDYDAVDGDWRKQYPKDSLIVNRKPAAPSDGKPQHLFLAKEDESALSKKLMLWGGRDGIVSFEGMLTNDLEPVNAPKDTACDIGWLRTYEVPDGLAFGKITVPLFRFICIPNAPYTDSIPTGMNIIDDLCYSGKFKSSKNPGLDTYRMTYGKWTCDYSDELHNERDKQNVFSDQKSVDRMAEAPPDDLKATVKSMEAHRKLEEYVKDKRLYYAAFHTKEHEAHSQIGSKKDVYVFAVGVSPYGNLVGVMSMQLAEAFTGYMHIPIGGDDDDDAEEEDDDESDDENAEPDPRAIMRNNRPDPLPDGSPQHIFYEKENESQLSSKLMLYDGHKGVVSFEGMLPVPASDDSQLDVVFLRSLLDGPMNMAAGAATVPVFPFICIPDDPYVNRKPNSSDIIRDLRYEESFSSEGRGEGYIDQVHSNRDKQYIFSSPNELKDLDDDDNNDEELKEDIRKSIAAHVKLESFVKDKLLHYAVFHTKPHKKLGFVSCDYIYVFAVGVSPKTGNLVGVFSMQISHNMTD